MTNVLKRMRRFTYSTRLMLWPWWLEVSHNPPGTHRFAMSGDGSNSVDQVPEFTPGVQKLRLFDIRNRSINSGAGNETGVELLL